MRRRGLGLGVGGLVMAVSALAAAQTTQIKPRVMVMIDTSGSMTEHISDGNNSGGDGSSQFTDPNLTRTTLYRGNALNGSCTMPNGFDGVNSRMFAAKAAMTNVVAGSGDIDWGLMKYIGAATQGTITLQDGYCPVVGTVGAAGANCGNDDGCGNDLFCIGGKCRADLNMCVPGANFSYSETNNKGGTCGTRALPGTYRGTACSTGTTGGVGTPCASLKACNVAADCGSGGCTAMAGHATKVCACTNNNNQCPANYNCDTAQGRCVYNRNCFTPGGSILADPSAGGYTPAKLLSWVDGVEDYTADATNNPRNPELRAVGATPLAGSARSATTWYNSVVASDPVKDCRPYVLVQVTDGDDTCDTDDTAGPAAAASGFVAATVSGKPSKPFNRVYVIGLNIANAKLDGIAQAGGTGAARLATSQPDIEAALADIVSSSVLVEKCNGADDNCNGQCDENFPGVGVNATGSDGQPCSNPHSAASCNNGYPPASHCFDQGVFKCSTDQLNQVCSAQICVGGVGGMLSSPSAGVMRISNVTGIGSSAVGQLLVVGGASKAANNGVFVVTAVGANTVDVANAAVSMPDSASVSYGVPSNQGAATITRPAAGVERLTVNGATGVVVGDQVTVVGAAPAADNGTFTVTAVNTTVTGGVTTTTIDLNNVNAAAGTMPGLWADPRQLCPIVETCNGIDDDCNGIIDDCGGGGAGSCCTSMCPACAKPPFVETCNNCDDDCDGTIDNNLVDTGLVCGNNVGDCAPGVTVCCSNDPNTGPCLRNGTMDQIWCQGGNPGYPKPMDLCDGTDDNCNGVANDNPPLICFTDGVNTLPMSKDGVGACHHGIQQCQTVALPAGDPGCPPGWPAGKTCPKAPPVYGPCTGLVTPQNEFCNGIDDDCDGPIDNNLKDPWADPTNPQYPTAHPCCSTGNPADCMNTGASPPAMCKLGGFVCQGGAKVCLGSVAKSIEVCNGLDDDCNGIIDDVPGVGTPCTGTGDCLTNPGPGCVYTKGECRAVLQCVTAGMPPQCVQTVGPKPEVCNGKDDNCNNQIDDTNPPMAPAGGVLPGVGVACDLPMPPADKPPCKPGTTVCVAGMIDCQGAVHPMPNQCNGISTDCTGLPNTNGNCPTGFGCYQGNCVAPCQGGEFPCPGGYACNTQTPACDSNGSHPGCCVPDECEKISCPPGFICHLDAQGMAQCVDPCMNVTCPSGYLCKLGACVDASCRTQGCPSGQICVATGNNMFQCQPDPCADVTCEGNQFCKDGTCVNTCIGPCPPGNFCDKGTCAPDPCGRTPCLAGQVCRVEQGIGVCVENQCQFGCGLGQVCCGGECVADACEHLHCPEDTHCALTSACAATCETNPSSPKDQIVGAGSGGFGCAVGGASGATADGRAGWLLVAGLVWLVLRRRRATAGVGR